LKEIQVFLKKLKNFWKKTDLTGKFVFKWFPVYLSKESLDICSIFANLKISTVGVLVTNIEFIIPKVCNYKFN